jgi:DedD protein
MGLLSIFQSKDKVDMALSGSASDLADAVQQARVRARHRLIGAAVLVMLGVIAFPLLFETEPRPVAVDIPIEIPRKETAPALAMPEVKQTPRAAPAEPIPTEVLTKPLEEPAAARETAPAKAAHDSSKQTPSPSAGVGSPRPEASQEKLLRFVVQVGAFSESQAIRETRLKVEKIGFKTFIQTADTTDGKRTRVRVGPFNSRDEADKVQAKLKAAGLQAVVLTL